MANVAGLSKQTMEMRNLSTVAAGQFHSHTIIEDKLPNNRCDPFEGTSADHFASNVIQKDDHLNERKSSQRSFALKGTMLLKIWTCRWQPLPKIWALMVEN